MGWDFEKDPYRRGFLEGYGRHLITALRREGYPEGRVREITVSELIDRFEMPPEKAGRMANSLILHSSWPLGVEDAEEKLELDGWREIPEEREDCSLPDLFSDRKEEPEEEILEMRKIREISKIRKIRKNFVERRGKIVTIFRSRK